MVYEKGKDYCSRSPDVLFGVRISKACYLHDRQYRNEVRKRQTREEADLDLMKNIIKEFKKASKGTVGVFVGFIYYFIVRIFNWRYWIK